MTTRGARQELHRSRCRRSMGMLIRAALVVLVALNSSALPNARSVTSGNSLDAPDATHLSKLDRAVRRALEIDRRASRRVIVRTSVENQPSIAEKITGRGGRVTALLSSVSGVAATLSADEIEQLALDPTVDGVSSDAVVASSGLAASDALMATLPRPGGVSGKNVTIAVIDSGVEPGPDFGSRLIAFYDFTRGGVAAKAYDDYGHGTHVAGLIAGKDTGVARDARIVALKVLDANGAGFTSDVIRAIDFVVANQTTLGVQILNLSMGHPILEPAATDPLVQSVDAAARAGIVVVVSAGNYGRNPVTGLSGYAGILSPGNAPSAITVGAVNTQQTVGRYDDRVADYSSRGPTWYDALAKPDLVAPGHSLTSVAALKGSLYLSHPELRVGSNYMRLSGTSMAAAVASGTVALIIEANRQTFKAPLTPNTVKAALQWAAIRMADADYLTQGAGSLNAAGAIAIARSADPARPVGVQWLVGPLPLTTTIDNVSWPLAQTVVWDNTLTSGSVMSTNQPAWGQTIVWGNTVVWGNGVGWSNDVVWEDSSTWSSTVVWGNALIGTTDGSTVVWGNTTLSTDTVVWGNLADSSTLISGNAKTVVWGNLAGSQ